MDKHMISHGKGGLMRRIYNMVSVCLPWILYTLLVSPECFIESTPGPGLA